VQNVLDHGYVKVIETWGSDERIIEAARMSTDKGFQGWGGGIEYKCARCGYTVSGTLAQDLSHGAFKGDNDYNCPGCGVAQFRKHQVAPGDEKLLRFLYEHAHHTPFEMAGMTIEVQAPIFVFREWHRHRTQSYNELSARYTELPDLFYVPSLERMMGGKQSARNKQSSEGGFSEASAENYRRVISEAVHDAREVYEQLLRCGVAREVARVVIPVAQYSRMRASANLRNWLAFLTLRTAENAQWEIRQYANVVASYVRIAFPRTYELFAEGRNK
jgi:thymidylate synthase (FAD)